MSLKGVMLIKDLTPNNKQNIDLVRMSDEDHVKHFLTYDTKNPQKIKFSTPQEEKLYNSILSYDSRQSPLKTIPPGNYHIFTEVLNMSKQHRGNNHDFYIVSTLKHFLDKNSNMEIDIPINFYINYKNGSISDIISTNPQNGAK
jgi:hypothetical protein